MALVNTGEVVVLLTKDEALSLTATIKGHVSQAWRLLAEAHHRRADLALGYSSWEEYVRAEFDMGRAHAYRLLNQAYVIAEIEAAVVSVVDEEWMSPDGDIASVITEPVARDLGPRLVEVVDRIKDELTDADLVDADDLRDRLAEVVHDEREKAQQEAERKRQDRDAIATLNEQAQAAGMQTDAGVLAVLGGLNRLCADVVGLGDPVEFAERYRGELNAEDLGLSVSAASWLTDFNCAAMGVK